MFFRLPDGTSSKYFLFTCEWNIHLNRCIQQTAYETSLSTFQRIETQYILCPQSNYTRNQNENSF